jgi:hypothetical protein
MNGTLSGALTAAIYIILILFGWWFNRQVEKWGTDSDGFTWLLVVIGTLVTLVGIGLLDLLLDWNAGLLGLSAFSASGFFMCYGAVRRYVTLRNRLKEMARHDAAKTLAE